ncbi:hypothetical protein TVAG_128040 [Trichomonas vaginalis G3]|uniref:Transmembrane protein n=1 Tax=Trichomonas vaginalis (strain ATCC PRA-98 / G3) TaxID=412133 RepID=A2EBG5_TRIV3|nr:hypothetical protein TVAGG3_0406750 [Trichomonas vaginalis G3]EAY09995.1 hypothetical protein TVAG_128040 [Trichomonas vaginalis G3]KAI5535075.1 hypothetical protein TVAGG3_0406750 [Trichomonas vaginalis G3]|eukprot:XP_001322218.1 hypothetical protein [Trichomonas vaginalis G3]
MFEFLFSFSCSISISGVGYYEADVTSSGTSLEFNLPAVPDATYYLAFSKKDYQLSLDGESSNPSDIYRIDNLKAIYKASMSDQTRSKLPFGIFLVPTSFDALEFWIQPNSTGTYQIPQLTNNSKKIYLCILNDNPISITITQDSDTNTVLSSKDGNLPKSTETTISGTNIVTLEYSYIEKSTVGTTYTLTTQAVANNMDKQCYDKRKSKVNFDTFLIIPYFIYRYSVLDSSLKYGYNSITVSSNTSYLIPKNKMIIFVQSSVDVQGYISTEQYGLSILGNTKIQAIDLVSNGVLLFSANGSSVKCGFVIFNYSQTEICKYPTIFSGTGKYSLTNTIGSHCIITVFSEGTLSFDSTNYLRSTVNTLGITLKDKTISEPSLTVIYYGETYNADDRNTDYTIVFDYKGATGDLNYVIESRNSYYQFYKVSSQGSESVNVGGVDYAKKVLIKPKYKYLAFLTLILVIAAVVFIYYRFCAKKPNNQNDNEDHSSD